MIKDKAQDVLAIVVSTIIVVLLMISEYIVLPLIYLVGKATDKVKEVMPFGK